MISTIIYPGVFLPSRFTAGQVNSMVDTLKVILEEVGRVAREVGVEGQQNCPFINWSSFRILCL